MGAVSHGATNVGGVSDKWIWVQNGVTNISQNIPIKLASPANGHILLWDEVTQQFTNAAPPFQSSSMVTSNFVGTVGNNVTNVADGWGIDNLTATGTLTTTLTNAQTLIASNSTSVQIDFSAGTPDYKSTDVMRANLSVQPTNLVVGRSVTVYLTGDTNANERTVTVITNGIAGGAAIRWFFNTPTNGATSFTVTNLQRSELSLKVLSATEIWAAWSPVR